MHWSPPPLDDLGCLWLPDQSRGQVVQIGLQARGLAEQHSKSCSTSWSWLYRKLLKAWVWVMEQPSDRSPKVNIWVHCRNTCKKDKQSYYPFEPTENHKRFWMGTASGHPTPPPAPNKSFQLIQEALKRRLERQLGIGEGELIGSSNASRFTIRSRTTSNISRR